MTTTPTPPAVTEVTDTDLDQVQGGILIGLKPLSIQSPRDAASGQRMTRIALPAAGMTTSVRTS